MEAKSIMVAGRGLVDVPDYHRTLLRLLFRGVMSS